MCTPCILFWLFTECPSTDMPNHILHHAQSWHKRDQPKLLSFDNFVHSTEQLPELGVMCSTMTFSMGHSNTGFLDLLEVVTYYDVTCTVSSWTNTMIQPPSQVLHANTGLLSTPAPQLSYNCQKFICPYSSTPSTEGSLARRCVVHNDDLESDQLDTCGHGSLSWSTPSTKGRFPERGHSDPVHDDCVINL